MRTSLFSTAILLVTLLAAGGDALACSCMTMPQRERFKHSALVFEGEVVRIVPHKDYPTYPVGYTFQVTKILKGEDVTEVTLPRVTNCDQRFTVGGVYRVYAYRWEGKLLSSICSGNKLLRRKRRSNRSVPV